MTITPGPVLIADRYEVGDLLGRGGMADVYEGIDHRLRRPVAIKRLRPEMAARDDIRVRFESEARTAARLAHPNAVSVFDTGEHKGIPYIVMERLPGESLADRMAAGPVDPDWLRTVALQVLDALAAAHAAGIVHRDVKPSNILLGADGRAMIADFGIAKSVTAGDIAGGLAPDPTQTGQWVGTPAYIAPERLNGGPATPQSDLYALGVVLYEALAGEKPFTGTTPLATAQAIVSGDRASLAEIRPDLDPAVVATVEQAMSVDPARRFASAQDMANALAGSLATTQSPTVAAPVTATQVFGDRGFALAGAAPHGRDAPPDGTGAIVRRRWRRVWIWAGIGLVGLVMMLLLASTVNNDPAPTNSDAAASDSPAMQLAGKLRAQAARLSPADGPAAAQAAQRLEEVAAAVERNEGGPVATALVAQVGEWNRNGELSDPATQAIVGVLQQVPGVDMTALSPPPAAPRSAGSSRTGNAPAAPQGDDKGKQKDEQKTDEVRNDKKAEGEAPGAGDRDSSESVTEGATSSDQEVEAVSPDTDNSGDVAGD